jgi:hypothetical protein
MNVIRSILAFLGRAAVWVGMVSGQLARRLTGDSLWDLVLDASFQPEEISREPTRLALKPLLWIGGMAFAILGGEIAARVPGLRWQPLVVLFGATLGLLAGIATGPILRGLMRALATILRLRAPDGALLTGHLGGTPLAPLALFSVASLPFAFLVSWYDPWLFAGGGIVWGVGALAGALYRTTGASRRSLLAAVVVQATLGTGFVYAERGLSYLESRLFGPDRDPTAGASP